VNRCDEFPTWSADLILNALPETVAERWTTLGTCLGSPTLCDSSRVAGQPPIALTTNYSDHSRRMGGSAGAAASGTPLPPVPPKGNERHGQ